ncbi:hypothetical protein GRAN_4166 [Granulicella sibirica]|uniref:Uncharacterized protein n=1 Tax=Granulicella sibirica TaxID=2479048 RepID=A0A4Q0SXA2_9BACT|nr:hypothetical protein GRAN_4166 [Granulicella sibirica]
MGGSLLHKSEADHSKEPVQPRKACKYLSAEMHLFSVPVE